MAKKKHRKDIILDKALQIYVRKGPEELTMRHIAKRAGITVSGLYKHYRNKDDLMYAMFEEGFNLFADYLAVAEKEPGPEKKLRKLGDQYRKFAVEHEMYYRLIMMNAPKTKPRPEDIPEGFIEITSRSFHILLKIVNENIRAGFLKNGDPEQIAITIWAMVHGLVSLYIGNMLMETEEEFKSFFHTSFDRLYEGLKN